MRNAQILVVEDEVIVAENIRGMLRSFGYSAPSPAISGEEAVQRAESAPPDLALIDIQLGGGMDGVAAALKMRARRDIPIVYITAYADDETLRRAMVTEPYGYLVKPFAIGELRSTVEMALFRYDLQRKLRDSEARCRAIIEEQRELILRFLPDGAIVFANQSCCGYFGRQPEDLIGQNFLLLIASEDRAATRERLASLSRKSPETAGDARVEPGDGRERRVWWVYRAAYSDQGRLAEIQAVGRDVTSRWRTEEALRQRNAWLEQVNQAGQTFVASLDLDQVVAKILESLRQQLKVIASSVWLIDQQTGELVCHYATEPNKTVVLGWRLAPGQGIAGWVATSGQSVVVPDVRRDPRHFREVDDQTGLRLTSMISVPLRVKDRVIGVVQAMDTTPNRFNTSDLKYVELLGETASIAIENAHLYQETDRLRAFSEDIVQSMDEGIMLENEAGIITFVNPRLARLLGYTAEDLVGREWSDILAPDQVVAMVAERNRWPRSVIGRCETVLMASDGEHIPVIVSARSMFRQVPGGREELLDPQSGLRFVGKLSVFTDIRELKRAEQAIRQRLAAEELMAGISTRFINTPPAQVDREIERALEAAGRFAGVERVFLALVADDGVTIGRRYSWLAPGTWAGDDAAAAPLSLSDYPWAREKVLCGEPIYIARTSALPQEAAAEKAYLRALGVEATLGVPLMHEQRLAALMGFHSQREERKWSEEDANLLRLLGEILLNALDRQQAQEQIARSLREKDILLKEVHHRVNDNLQVICSLLDLQAGAAADSQAAQAFAQTRNRIHAMALVHEKIYRSKELGRVEAADTVEELTRNLYAVYAPGREDICLTVQVDHVVLEPDAMIPLALVINELVSNAVRHAFPAGWDTNRGEAGCRPELRVEFHHEPAHHRLVLCVSDNGVGLPPGYDWRTASSLGLQLVRMLTEQLEGTADVTGNAGTCISIAFPAGGAHALPA